MGTLIPVGAENVSLWQIKTYLFFCKKYCKRFQKAVTNTEFFEFVQKVTFSKIFLCTTVLSLRQKNIGPKVPVDGRVCVYTVYPRLSSQQTFKRVKKFFFTNKYKKGGFSQILEICFELCFV